MADTTPSTHPAPDPRSVGNTVTTPGPSNYPQVEYLVTTDHQTVDGNGTTTDPLRVVGAGAVPFAMAAVTIDARGTTLTAGKNVAGLSGSAGVYTLSLTEAPIDWVSAIITCGCGPHLSGGGEGPAFKTGCVMTIQTPNSGVVDLSITFWEPGAPNTPIDPSSFWVRVDLADHIV